MEGMRHRMVRVHLVDEADLDLAADAEAPGDGPVLRTRWAVHELPAHVRRSGYPVHLDHVVLPLDAVGSIVSVPVGIVVVLRVMLVTCVLLVLVRMAALSHA